MSTVTTPCRYHPQQPSAYTCSVCQAPLCDECIHARDDGILVCADCLAPEPLEADSDSGAYDLEPAPAEPPPLLTARGPRRFAIGLCANHPEVEAFVRCDQCGSFLCDTCVFNFPGDVHLCPTCATDPKQKLPTKRKLLAGWSIGLGSVAFFMSVLAIVLIIVAVMQARREEVALQAVGAAIAGGCMIILCIPLAIIGFFLGLAAFDKRSHNPGFLWIGPILNGLVAGVWIMRFIWVKVFG